MQIASVETAKECDMKKQHGLAVLAVAGGLIFLANTASAGSVIWTPPSSCSMLNCDATILHANITSSLSNPGGSIEPFVLQLHSSPQFCLRLDVIKQETAAGGPADLEMVLVGPDETVWRNNDRGPGDTRPLIVVPRGAQGWYTVHISTAPGWRCRLARITMPIWLMGGTPARPTRIAGLRQRLCFPGRATRKTP